MTHEPRILLADIETCQALVYTFSLKVNGYIHPDAIVRHPFISVICWKWLGEARVHSVDVLSDPSKKGEIPEAEMLRKFSAAMEQADAVVTQNGDEFDIPWINGRLCVAVLPPMKPVTQIDTKKIAASKFRLLSNSQDALARVMGLPRKIQTTFQLWVRSAPENMDKADRAKAIAEMVRYCKGDVRGLEALYLRVRPFAPAKVNRAIDAVDDSTCPSCGGTNLVSRGYQYTRVTASKRFQCRDCGAWSSRPCGSRVVR